LHAHQHVPRLEHTVGWAFRHRVAHDEHADRVGEGGTDRRLRLGTHPQPTKLVEGAAYERGLQRASRDGLPRAQELECAHDPVEGQIEAGGRARCPAGVQGHDATACIDHRRARRSAGGVGGGLQVEGVEVVVAVPPVDGSVAIEAGQRAGEDRELLSRVVAHDPHLGAYSRAFRRQRELDARHEAQVSRVVAEEAEVVDGIPVEGLELHLLVILKDGLGHRRAGLHDVAIGQDDPPLRVDHEARGGGGGRALRIEGAGRSCADHHDGRDDAVERLLPGVGRRGGGEPGGDEEPQHGGRVTLPFRVSTRCQGGCR
jgi:hypothetical protein